MNTANGLSTSLPIWSQRKTTCYRSNVRNGPIWLGGRSFFTMFTAGTILGKTLATLSAIVTASFELSLVRGSIFPGIFPILVQYYSTNKHNVTFEPEIFDFHMFIYAWLPRLHQREQWWNLKWHCRIWLCCHPRGRQISIQGGQKTLTLFLSKIVIIILKMRLLALYGENNIGNKDENYMKK